MLLRRRPLATLLLTTLLSASAHGQGAPAANDELSRDVEIIRTTGGVPHVRAANLRAAGYALGWLMLEDYGPRTAQGVLRSSGRMGLVFGRDSLESDFLERLTRARAVEQIGRAHV